jgi:hypothetical protein
MTERFDRQAEQDAAIAAVGDRTGKRGGISAAVAESHDLGIEARAAAERARAAAALHEQAATILTDCALADGG